jgi:hypothetical protein
MFYDLRQDDRRCGRLWFIYLKVINLKLLRQNRSGAEKDRWSSKRNDMHASYGDGLLVDSKKRMNAGTPFLR